MKNNLRYLRDESFSVILDQIHKEMKAKMDAIKDDKKAEEIEKILTEIKKTAIQLSQNKSDSAIDNYLSSQLSKLIINTFNQQLTIHSNLKNSSSLFLRRHKDVQSKIADDIFQEQLAALISAASKMRGINVSIDSMLGGRNLANTQALNKLSENIETQILELTNLAIKNQSEKIKSKMKKNVKIEAKAGKVDVFTPRLEIQYNAEDLISSFLNAISGATFTLKNYSSSFNYKDKKRKDLSDIDIHLGNTNIYKSITGALSSILTDPRAQKRVYYRGMTILAGISESPDSATEEQVSKHFGHLRFIFELRGEGLINTKTGNKESADFIIWNDPTSEKIVVRSTASLIKKYWEQYARPFGEISISASRVTKK